MTSRTLLDVSALATAELAAVRGGAGINFDSAPQAIQQVVQRAAVCRALHDETRRLSGGRDPRPGTDAAAMAAATRACWKSFGS